MLIQQHFASFSATKNKLNYFDFHNVCFSITLRLQHSHLFPFKCTRVGVVLLFPDVSNQMSGTVPIVFDKNSRSHTTAFSRLLLFHLGFVLQTWSEGLTVF